VPGGGTEAWAWSTLDHSPLQSFDRATFADLAQVRHYRLVAVLNVRRVGEWHESHIEGAVNISIHELLERVGEVLEVRCGCNAVAGTGPRSPRPLSRRTAPRWWPSMTPAAQLP